MPWPMNVISQICHKTCKRTTSLLKPFQILGHDFYYTIFIINNEVPFHRKKKLVKYFEHSYKFRNGTLAPLILTIKTLKKMY